MKLFLVLFAAIGLPSLAFAQTNAETEKGVMKLEQDFSAALTKSDAAAAESMLADNYFASNPDGTLQNKSEFVADMKSGDLKFESNKLEDMKVQIATTDFAVVTYRSNDKVSYKGKDLSGQYRWTDVLMKRGGKWQFVVSHGSKIETQP